MEDNETINAVIDSLYPAEPVADNDYIEDNADQRTLRGAGTESDPYQISTPEDLNKVRYYIVNTNLEDEKDTKDPSKTVKINSQVIDGYFKLTGNIDMSDVENWTPIGMTDGNKDVRYKTAFVGTFDGGDFTISNLTLNTEHQGIGLFTRVGEGGTVKNLTIDTCTVGDETTTTQEIGAICGTAWGATFSDITLKKITIKGGGYAGGLSGDIWSVDDTGTSVTDCSIADSSISGGAATGGLIGRTHDQDILTGCKVSSTSVTASGHSVGGLVGILTGQCADCHTENVTVTSTMNGSAYAGGLFGQGSSILSGCSASGTVSAGTNGQYAGGWGAYYTGEKIENCSANVTVSALYYVGGLIGFISHDGTEITNCHATGDVEITGSDTGKHMAGGLIGRINKNKITGCYATGDVTDKETTIADGNTVGVGGMLGIAGDSEISGCYATGAVTGATSTGGLIGRSSSSVSNCHATGAVSGSGATGGAIGFVASGTIKNSYATGDVTGGSDAGGFVGWINAGATIESAAATGAVTSDSGDAGGFVGHTNGAPTIKNALAAGTVSGTNAGAFVGTAANAVKGIESCYANSTSSVPFTGKYTGYYSPQNCFWAGNVTGMLSNNSTPNGSAGNTPDYYYAQLNFSEMNAIYGGKLELAQTNTIGSSVTDGTTPKHTLAVKTSPEGLVSVDTDGSMTASAAGTGTLSLVMEINGEEFVFGTANVTVDPMPITFGTSTGENPNGNIQYAFTGMAPEFSQFATFYQAVKGEDDKYKPGTNKIPLTEGTDIVFNYDAGAGAHDYDYLPINVTEAEGIEVTVKLVNPNYRFVTESNSNLSQTITEKVIVQAAGKTEVPFIDLPAAGESMTYEYTGSGLAPIGNLTRISAGTIDKFTVHFHPWGDTEFTEAHLENKPTSELTPEAVLGIAPKEPGTYLMIVDGVSDTQYAYQSYIFTITKAAVKVKAVDKSIYVGDEMPEFTYTVTGLASGDSLTGTVTLSCNAENTNTAGIYTITPSGGQVDEDHYTLAYETGTLTVRTRSSGGGGSSSGSGNTTTETTRNPDGSTTTTVTDKKTGTVTETTKFKDGSTLVVETKKDGTVTTTDTAANGVKVKTVDEPGEDVTAAVTIPRSVGEATVTIPADVDYGMVAVDADTGEIVKLSVPTEDGMLVKLEGSADLVLVDNAKDFTDTRNHWAEDAIDFATSHELFAGTSETTFTPDSPMTRAMLMTVLARFDGEDTTGGSVWYEKGMEWAKASGVSDGSNPNGSITREQFATMLWRYAGSPAVDGSLADFSDSAKVNGYAVDAMRWAVSSGIISGMGDGTLAPQGNATRAQVSTMLMRFIVGLTK